MEMTRRMVGLFHVVAGVAAGVFALLMIQLAATGAGAAVMLTAAALMAVIALGLWLVRREVVFYTDSMTAAIDALLDGRRPEAAENGETVLAKNQAKLVQLHAVMERERGRADREKAAVEQLVGDISHQVKTPIANLRMYSEIVRDRELAPEERRQFMDRLISQAERLDFLTRALVKVGRLETGVLRLAPRPAPLAETVARAVEQIAPAALAKGQRLTWTCDGDITARHDPKWTAEAVGNILDNAVKYTPRGARSPCGPRRGRST